MTTAIYDGFCLICNQTRRTVMALDWFNRVEWLDLHNQEVVEERYPWLTYEQAMGAIHVVDSEDEIYAAYFAVRRMMRDLPLGLPIWAVLHIPGMDWIGQRVYMWIARNRYKINKFFGVELDECVDGYCKLPYSS